MYPAAVQLHSWWSLEGHDDKSRDSLSARLYTYIFISWNVYCIHNIITYIVLAVFTTRTGWNSPWSEHVCMCVARIYVLLKILAVTRPSASNDGRYACARALPPIERPTTSYEATIITIVLERNDIIIFCDASSLWFIIVANRWAALQCVCGWVCVSADFSSFFTICL